MDRKELLKKFREAHSADLYKKLLAEHKKRPFTVPDQDSKKSKVCLVFSCPGQWELIRNQVCQEDTGDNLDKLLEILNKKRQDLFPYPKRDKYDILNATNVVHFYALDGRTEGTKGEIEKNKKRIEKYLETNNNLKYVILFGNKAQITRNFFDKNFDKNKIIESRHLSFHSINQIDLGNKRKSSKSKKKKDTTIERLKIVAKEILSQIKD